MKFFSTIAISILGFSALSLAAPFASAEANEALELVQREAASSDVTIAARTTETGAMVFSISKRAGEDDVDVGDDDATVDLVEKPDGTIVFIDSEGKEHSLDDLEKIVARGGDELAELEARGIPWKWLIKLGPILKKYGVRAAVSHFNSYCSQLDAYDSLYILTSLDSDILPARLQRSVPAALL